VYIITDISSIFCDLNKCYFILLGYKVVDPASSQNLCNWTDYTGEHTVLLPEHLSVVYAKL
jgi:hypothetical protein